MEINRQGLFQRGNDGEEESREMRRKGATAGFILGKKTFVSNVICWNGEVMKMVGMVIMVVGMRVEVQMIQCLLGTEGKVKDGVVGTG